MASPRQAGDVLPRPRIPNVLGVLNIIVATFLMLYSLYLGWYVAIMPAANRAMIAVREKAEADLDAQRQADMKALDEAEKTATTAAEKAELASRREALAAQPKLVLPIGLDLEKLGMGGSRFTIYGWVDIATALVLDVLLLVAGIGLVRRKIWGIRLAIATAAAKILRLVVLYSFVVLAIVPQIAQACGRMAFEMVTKQQPAGAKMPPAISPTFFTKFYFVAFTASIVSMMLSGTIYPAISLWFLSRPGARAACEPRVRNDRRWSDTRILGVTNVVFASCLILFGMCVGAYIAILPVVGRVATQFQKKIEADAETKKKVALEEIAEDEKKASTDAEKEVLAQRRKAIESRPKPPNAMAALDLGRMAFDDPRIVAYYWVELTTGLLLNLAMITAGIGLLRRKPWAISLGVVTAAAKVLRLVLVYSFFALAVAPVLAKKTAAMMGQMIIQQQAMFGGSALAKIDTGPLEQAYGAMYQPVAVAAIVLGSIYPAVSLWLLLRARDGAEADKKGPQDVELIETFS